MTKQIFFLFCITILAGVGIGMIVFKFDPYKTGEAVKFLFFSSLFVFMWSLGTMVFFVLNIASGDRWADSFRRGLFLSVLFLLLVFFKKSDIFVWYLGALLGGIFIILEALVYKKLNKRTSNDESR